MALSALRAFILALQMLVISHILYAPRHILVAALWRRISRMRRELRGFLHE